MTCSRRDCTHRRVVTVRAAARRPRGGSSTNSCEVDRSELGRLVRDDPHGLQDRVHEPVQPLDLLHACRGATPRGSGGALDVARRPALERRLLGEQVRVGAHDRERRPELVGDERDQLVAGLVERLELLDLRLGLPLEAALLDDPGEEVGDRRQLRDVLGR